MAIVAADWGVTVADVRALAPQVRIVDNPAETIPEEDGTYSLDRDRRVTVTQVESWIVDAGVMVSGEVHRWAKIKDENNVAWVTKAIKAIVAVRAAAYAVAAAFPAMAGVNDMANANAELWSRYQLDLEILKNTVGEMVDDEKANANGMGGSFRFPRTRLPDSLRF